MAALVPNGLNRKIYVAAYNTSGVFQNSQSATTGVHTVSAINVILDPSSTNAWVYWYLPQITTLNYFIVNASTTAVVLNTTTISAAISNLWQVTAFAISSTQQQVFYSIYTQPATALTIGVFWPITNQVTVSSLGVIGAFSVFKYGFDIYAKPFTAAGRNYIPLINLSQSASTGFLVDIGPVPSSDSGTFLPVAKFLQTEAEGLYEQGPDVTGPTYSAPLVVAVRPQSFLNPPLQFSSTLFGLPCGFVVTLAEEVPQLTAANQAAAPNLITAGAQMGVASISFDFSNIDAYQSVIQQDTLILNGGIVSQYDGAQITELGFSVDPDAVSLLGITSGGGMVGTGTGNKFIYYITYEWTDGNGNLHQSAPSLAATVVFTSGTTNSVKVGWQPLSMTQKLNVTAKVWRTIANGTIAYLVTAVQNVQTTWQTYTDTSSDTFIVNSPTSLH